MADHGKGRLFIMKKLISLLLVLSLCLALAPCCMGEGSQAAPAPAESAEDEELPAAYVDFDDMSFYVSGKKYTLGVSTLQEMIDDGVPFEEVDLEDAGNNLKANYESGSFRIQLGEYWTASVCTFNDTESGKPVSACFLSEVYLPLHSDEEQDVLSFAFPMDITMEELIANAGEPDETSHYDGDNGYYTDTVCYTRDSERYYSASKYRFEFVKGELAYVTINYVP